MAAGIRCAAVPLVLHEGYSPDDIVGLADQDNENDEYHVKVPIVDVWMEYKRLVEMWGKDAKWGDKVIARVASAKGILEPIVRQGLKYAEFPESVLRLFRKTDFLNNAHAHEIEKFEKFSNLLPWLDRDAAMLEIVTDMVAKHGKTVTAKHFAEKVAKSWGDVMRAREM